jgi:hypothetical protein
MQARIVLASELPAAVLGIGTGIGIVTATRWAGYANAIGNLLSQQTRNRATASGWHRQS